MSRKLLALLLLLFMLAGFCSCAGASAAEDAEAEDTTDEVVAAPENMPQFEPTEYTCESFTLTAKSTDVVRELLSVPESTGYMISAKLVLESVRPASKYGFCAVSSSSTHLMDLYCAGTGAMTSCATIYGNEMRSDLGTVAVAQKAPAEEFDLTVIREGDLYYYVVNGRLYQIREFRSDKGVPGFCVSYGTVIFKNVEYTNDPAKTAAAVSKYLADFEGYGFGNDYASFEGIEFIDASSFTYPVSFQKMSTDATRMAFKGSYKGNMEITFKTKDLVANSTYDNTGDGMCRLRFMLYYENGQTDMICLGVANKQDRVETYAHYDVLQWFNHTDLTGGNGYFDWNAENEIRIALSNSGYSTAYSVYINGKLCAVRSTCTSGAVSFGFESENISGTVSNFKVTGGTAE